MKQMPRKGYDVFYGDPDSTQEKTCLVCGSLCGVTRNAQGATGFAEAMSRQTHVHDRFQCLHSGKPWHDLAEQLVLEIENTASKRLQALINEDLQDLLKENLPVKA